MDVPSPRLSSNIDYSELDERYEIIRAVLKGDSEGLRGLLDKTRQNIVSIVDENSYTLMHMATYNNNEKIVQILIDHLKDTKFAQA